MTEFNDLYAVLGVSSTAPYEVIRAAYRVMARLHHPDLNMQTANETSRMTYINQAYEILSCPQRRREYDISINLSQKQNTKKRVYSYFDEHKAYNCSTTVLTTYDNRGRLHAYAS